MENFQAGGVMNALTLDMGIIQAVWIDGRKLISFTRDHHCLALKLSDVKAYKELKVDLQTLA
jgi:hypothetical protein